MIQVIPENRLTFILTTEGQNDIGLYSNVIKKCYKEANKAGFRNMFTRQERDFIEEMANMLGVDKEEKHEDTDKK